MERLYTDASLAGELRGKANSRSNSLLASDKLRMREAADIISALGTLRQARQAGGDAAELLDGFLALTTEHRPKGET